MFVDLIKLGAEWFAEVQKKLRGRKAMKGATMLYEAGVVVVAMRALRNQMNGLLGPLRNFNPEFWDLAKRRARIEELRKFATEPSHPFDLLFEHTYHLRKYEAEPKGKVEIHRLTRRLVELANNITHFDSPLSEEIFEARAAEQAWAQNIERYYQEGVREFGEVSVRGRRSDSMFIRFLPELLWLVCHAEDEQDVEALRRLADGLLRTRSRSGDDPIGEVVEEAQVTFASLKGEVMDLYPEIPTLSWADPQEA